MIPDIQSKYDQLTDKQKEIFAGYGLRQIKHFVEISLPLMESHLPENTYVQGINAEGKVQALNPNAQKNYLWISDLQWQERVIANMQVDAKDDFIAVWRTFELHQYPLVELSHVHRDFLNAAST